MQNSQNDGGHSETGEEISGFCLFVPQKWNEWKIRREIYAPNLWHFKQDLPAIVFEKCQSSSVSSLGLAIFSRLEILLSQCLPLLPQTRKQWGEAGRGGIIWICPSQVAAFLVKHKLFILEFTACELAVRPALFIQLLISGLKKYGKLISLKSECAVWQRSAFCSVCCHFIQKNLHKTG